MNPCNVCGKACTKKCSLCQLVFYCSAECQKVDWKRGHKRECKGKQKKTSMKKKKKHGGLAIESLPEEVLVHIGKSVVEYCGVKPFTRFAQTSKRIHRILTNKKFTSTLLECENERIFNNVFPSGDSSVRASSLEELALCQMLADAESTGFFFYHKIYFLGTNLVDNMLTSLHLDFVATILMQNPSAKVILDAHCGVTTPVEDAIETSKTIGDTTSNQLRQRFEAMVGPSDGLNFFSRVRTRHWGKKASTAAAEMEGDHSKHVQDGMGWVELVFRIGKVEVPPLPKYCANLAIPKEVKPYDPYKILMVMIQRQLIFDSVPARPEDVLPMVIREFQTTGTTRMGYVADKMVAEIISEAP